MKWRTITTLAVLAWLAATLGGTWLMLVYSYTPGETGAAPDHWPQATWIRRADGKPTLVIFIHPHCACSRASIEELAVLMAHSQRLVEARAELLAPPGTNTAWTNTDLWQAAAAIPGVTVERDEAGREASHFQATTSGDTFLYATDGRLLFHGGITLARGHSGDNPGRSAIEALLDGTSAPPAATAVFGCALFEDRKPTGSCKR